MRWDAARAASRRELPKPRKMMGPYSTLGGHWRASSGIPEREDQVCSGCHYHVCSCKPVDHLAKLKAAVLKHPDWEIVPHKYLRRGDIMQACGRTYANPIDIKEFTFELERAGVPCRAASFDDHARHAAEHVQVAERFGICGLCHGTGHKFMQCPELARLYRESLEFYK